MLENEIKNIFNIDTFIFKKDKNLCGEKIFILQYPEEKNISFSGGKIIEVKGSQIRYNASTEKGSSGSPIIRRLGKTSSQENEYQVIGIYSSAGHKKYKDYPEYNIGIGFDLIIPDIIFKNNALEIIGIQNEPINLTFFLTGDEIGIREIFKIIQFGNEYKSDKSPMLNLDNKNIFNKRYIINETKIQINLKTEKRYNFVTEKRCNPNLPPNLIKNCICLFLVYDISTTESFEDLKKLIESIEEEIKLKTLLVLVGIKLKEERNINYEEGYNLSYKNKMLFFEIDTNSKDVVLKLDNDMKKVISEILSDLKLLNKR